MESPVKPDRPDRLRAPAGVSDLHAGGSDAGHGVDEADERTPE